MAQMAIDRPELAGVLDRDASSITPKVAFAMYVLYVFAYAFHIRQRKVLRDNEWYGWFRIIRTGFDQGTIGEHWKTVEPKNWFDPEFKEFIETEIIGRKKQ